MNHYTEYEAYLIAKVFYLVAECRPDEDYEDVWEIAKRIVSDWETEYKKPNHGDLRDDEEMGYVQAYAQRWLREVAL